jgi:hypothetical protein
MFNFILTLQTPFARLESDGGVYEVLCRVRHKDTEFCTPNLYFSVDVIDAETGCWQASNEVRQYATGVVRIWEA